MVQNTILMPDWIFESTLVACCLWMTISFNFGLQCLLGVGKDGLMCCDKCKSKFRRDRHFKSHKCQDDGDIYLKPDQIPELEEGFDSRIRFPVSHPVDTNSTSLLDSQPADVSDDDETEVE